ncbi:hypothetical protein [Phaeacidiphilus oryzae]|uniref:hypothetical protein n=1 Tax=Phaeacidiphilus oryzae TaxID=348818 RepID=UPI00055EE60E|nr:hypothetical protein [Phaeacidiphilus oryzae]
MKNSLRRTAAAMAACASAGTGALAAAGTASATELAPVSQHQADQVNAVEHTVSGMDVPFTVPLGEATRPLLGRTTHAQVSGSLPASPVVPPSVKPSDPGEILPDPLVPALNGPAHTPSLGADAPLVDGSGRVTDHALGLGLPKSPMDAAGAALSLGHPLGLGGAQAAHTRSAQAGSDLQGVRLGDLEPALTPPHLSTRPNGGLTLEQRTTGQSVTKPVDGVAGSLNDSLHNIGV